MLLNGVVDGRSLLQQGEVKKVMDLVGSMTEEVGFGIRMIRKVVRVRGISIQFSRASSPDLTRKRRLERERLRGTNECWAVVRELGIVGGGCGRSVCHVDYVVHVFIIFS